MDLMQDIISLSDFSQQGSVLDGIDKGLASIEAGKGIDAADFFGWMENRHAFLRQS